MIPGTWLPCRHGDGELVGYLAPLESGEVSPRSLIGTPLGPPAVADAAAKLLAARGLAVLADKWWCRLPKPLVADVDVTAPDPAWPWRPVVLAEVGPGGASVRIAMPWPEEKTVQVRIPVPVDGILRTLPPE
jgi:hypothetical protein